jgi:hypothetical protein
LVITKLVALHFIAAGLVLLFCPQLGVGPILGGLGLMELFMRFGAIPCASLCGALFLGTSAFLTILVLSPQELRLANRHRFLNLSVLGALSLGVLMLLGREADGMSYAFWLVGAVLTGWLVMRAGSSVRLRSRALAS